MAAYQCLNCHQIERGGEDCCDKPELFCINDMPAEILKLRQLLREAAQLGLSFDIGTAYIRRAYIDQQSDLNRRIGEALLGT